MTQPTNPSRASGLSTLNEDQIAERGARMARRDDREYREYLREEQRSQPGCPACEMVLDQRGQATSPYFATICGVVNRDDRFSVDFQPIRSLYQIGRVCADRHWHGRTCLGGWIVGVNLDENLLFWQVRHEQSFVVTASLQMMKLDLNVYE